MLLKIGRPVVVNSLLRNHLKEAAISKRNNFSLLARCFFIKNDNSHQSFSAWERPVVFNPQCVPKCFSSEASEGLVDKLTFDNVCTETLDSLAEYFEELVESVPHLKNADVTYSDGVLTIHLGKNYGTYVINRQTPNSQIWLSSPTSGPKRYDFMNGAWVYKHDKTTLHSLLDREIEEIANEKVEFVNKCLHGKENV